MRILSIILTGAGLTLGIATPALAGEAATGTPPVRSKSFATSRPVQSSATARRWGPSVQGRWFAGERAPGGWPGYRRPTAGFVLPSYWLNPAYRIPDYGAYGLPVPAQGYGWSRYYNDAVMVDNHGRVRDHRDDIDWDQDGGDVPGATYDDDVTASDMPSPGIAYDSRSSGTGKDKDRNTASAEHEGRFEGNVRRAGVDYDAPPYAARPYTAPHVTHHGGGAGQPVVTTTQAPGHYANGYYYPGAMTTTVVTQPSVTTITSYVTEPARRPARRR